MDNAKYKINDRISGRYIIQRILGEGAFSSVYSAWDELRKQTIALKILKEEPDNLKQLQQELKILTKLHHRNVAQVYDVGQLPSPDQRYFLKLEYIEGKVLTDSLFNLSFEQACFILQQLLDAISYLHQHNIMHRDIKPDNIILSGERPVLVDFNIAKKVEGNGSSTFAGTPKYMPPEICTTGWDWTGDLYSVGMVFYEMVTRSYPFSHPKARFVSKKEPYNPQVFVAHLSEQLSQFMLKAISHTPQERFQTAEGMLLNLERVLTENPKKLNKIRTAREFYEPGNDYIDSMTLTRSDTEESYEELSKVYHCMIKTAEDGNPEAQFARAIDSDGSIGDILCDGVAPASITPSSSEANEAFYWMSQAANNGILKAKYKLGEYYFKGIGVIKDLHKAFNCLYELNESLEVFIPEVVFHLAWFYENGFGITQNNEKSFSLYKSIIDHQPDHSPYNSIKCEVYYRLGLFHENEVYVNQDFTAAMEYYKKSARAVMLVPEGNIRVSEMYFYGIGVKRNYFEALKYLQSVFEGTKNKRPWSRTSMNHSRNSMWPSTTGRKEESAIKGFALAHLLAKEGAQYAQVLFGDMLSVGWGGKQNYEQAIKWFRMSAEQGNAEALYRLGSMYRDGKGVERNRQEAIKWFEMAKKQGHKHAEGQICHLKTGEFYFKKT